MMSTPAELEREYAEAAAAVESLAAACAATAREADAANTELDGLTDADSVLRAMAEARAARNRLAQLRQRQTDAQAERRRLSVALERARLDAISGLVTKAQQDGGKAVIAAYQSIVAARDEIAKAQRAIGLSPASSPLDRVCDGLEQALAALGGSYLPDTSGSVTVRFGDFVYTRRPTYWTPPVSRGARVHRSKKAVSDLERVVQGMADTPW